MITVEYLVIYHEVSQFLIQKRSHQDLSSQNPFIEFSWLHSSCLYRSLPVRYQQRTRSINLFYSDATYDTHDYQQDSPQNQMRELLGEIVVLLTGCLLILMYGFSYFTNHILWIS